MYVLFATCMSSIMEEKGAMLTAANMHVAKKSMSTLFRNACCIIDMHVA
jgi:hypothetical protein